MLKKIMKNKGILILSFLITVLCGAVHADDILKLNGAGATFPYPLYSKWFYEYNKLFPNIQFNYQSIGSGGGIQQITAKTVDFGASDAPMSNDELAAVTGDILHFPTCLGAVVIAYNAPEIGSGLKLTGPVVADIFMGKVTKWNDPEIQKLNPDKKLPANDIMVIHRSDGSGTSYIFTEYLSKISFPWNDKIGTNKMVNWPVGLGGKGNEGVSGLLQQTPDSIGYIELGYALQNKITFASLQNKAGNFIVPSLDSVTAAASGAVSSIPKDYRVSITNASGPQAYPISAFTYLLVYKQQSDKAKGTALVNFLKWALHDGQKMTTPLAYAPIPAELVTREDKTIDSIVVPH